LIGRFGGAEFAVVLPATDAETARSVCERIVTALQNTGHVIGTDQARVTVSIGCATLDGLTPFDSAADFIKAADQALYAAKLLGRNRAVPFDRRIPATLAARRDEPTVSH
jgi:diguanylate cyclase (GGDEF)-like protein